MQNPFIGKTWVDRQVQYPGRRKLTDTTDPTDVKEVYVERAEGTVTEPGDVFDSLTMNGQEGRINNAFAAIAPTVPTVVTGTLAAGATSITLQHANILTTSWVDYYTSVPGVNPTGATIANGSVTLTFEAQESAITVGVAFF